MYKNRSYSKEFKDFVMKRIRRGETINSLSNELNIPKSTIYHWVTLSKKKQNNYSINIEYIEINLG